MGERIGLIRSIEKCDSLLSRHVDIFIDIAVSYQDIRSIIFGSNNIFMCANLIYSMDNDFAVVYSSTVLILNSIIGMINEKHMGKEYIIISVNATGYIVYLNGDIATDSDRFVLWQILREWLLVCHDNYNYLAIDRALGQENKCTV